MLPNIHILGIQGSGKGTQSSLLVTKFNLTYFSSGNQFRHRAQSPDALGQSIAQGLALGKLLPNKLLVDLVNDFLVSTPIAHGFLGDGVIRTLEQYQLLTEVWRRNDLDQPLLIYLDLDPNIAKARIAKRAAEQNNPALRDYHTVFSGKLLHRTDDNPQAIEQRFALFHSMTQPLVEVFQNKKRCISIPADQPIEAIHQQICVALQDYYPQLHESH